MILLSIDPGGTTGVAIFDDRGLVHTKAFKGPEMFDFLEMLEPTHVVIEKPPENSYSSYQTLLQFICGRLKDMYPEARWIQPGVWKGCKATRLPRQDFKTTHEWDAACLGRYAIAFAAPEPITRIR